MHKKTRRRKKRVSPLLIAIIISLLLHILLALSLSEYKNLIFPKPIKNQNKQDNVIEITEIPVPKEKETEPPKVTKRLAERSRKVEKEKTVDEFTRKGSPPSIPQREIPKRQETKVAKNEEIKSPEPLKKETVKEKQIKTAEVPKYDRADIQTPAKSDKPEKEQVKKDISKEDLFRTAQLPYPPSQQQRDSRSFSGTRNVPKEDTVDLNTTEYKYLSYFLKLKRQIEGVWNYPRESRSRGEQGELLLVFTLTRDGNLQGVKILEPSGYVRLDDEAVRAINVAAPFSPFPSTWDLDRLNVKAVFLYKFGWSFRQ